jgi:cytoskeleton protein RodZ
LHNGNVGVIGDTLSEARTRRAVDLEEVEAATGIRPRYLRAIEAEDWDALPEEFYARSFIRKYAAFLGVAPEPLVDEYRRQRGTAGHGSEAPTSPFARTSSRKAEALRRRRKRQAVYTWASLALIVAGVVVGILVLIGGGEGSNDTAGGGANGGGKGTAGGCGTGGANGAKGCAANGKGGAGGKGGGTANGGKGGAKGGEGSPGTSSRRSSKPTTVALKIEPTAEVWACVLDAKGKPLVDGATLAAGEAVGPFHSHSYTAAFGNGSVAVTVDGKPAETPSSPSPIGITVDSKGKVHALPEGERPSCE